MDMGACHAGPGPSRCRRLVKGSVATQSGKVRSRRRAAHLVRLSSGGGSGRQLSELSLQAANAGAQSLSALLCCCCVVEVLPLSHLQGGRHSRGKLELQLRLEQLVRIAWLEALPDRNVPMQGDRAAPALHAWPGRGAVLSRHCTCAGACAPTC